MENNRTLTQFELNIVEMFESLCGRTVSEDTTAYNRFYIESGYVYGYTKDMMLLECIHGINEWYSTTDTKDMLNNDWTFENVRDYITLLMTMPSDSTVLAVGNGYVSAPTDIRAYMHEAETGSKFIAFYDGECTDTTKDVHETLEELFPSYKVYEKPFTECFYTGGGIWCTVYQLSGKQSDLYYAIGSEEEDNTMCLYSHKLDQDYNDDEFAFGGVVRYIDIEDPETSEAERFIYYQLAECEINTMKEHGYSSPRKL